MDTTLASTSRKVRFTKINEIPSEDRTDAAEEYSEFKREKTTDKSGYFVGTYRQLTEGDEQVNAVFNSDEKEKGKPEKDQENFNSSSLYDHKKRFSRGTSLCTLSGSETRRKPPNQSSETKKFESGIQRLEYELSTLKSRLFDNLQEYEDLKDSFPEKNFPSEWEPPLVLDLRSKVSRLSERIEREKNKLKQKANDKEVRRMVENLLHHCWHEDIDDDLNPLERSVVEEVFNNDNNTTTKMFKKDIKKFQNYPVLEGSICKIPQELKTRQRKLFAAGDVPPRTPSERDASQAAMSCALSRLPPLSRRNKQRKFSKISPDEEQERQKIILIPNRRRLANGRAFVQERQKEFISFHSKRFQQMDVTFKTTAFEGFN